MLPEDLIYDLKLSSVVPSKITGDEEKSHELTNGDLAMKLHHITTLHFFEREAVEGLSIHDFKKPMFEWLDLYYPICGRIRRHEEEEGGGGGRPYVKCNDSGVRIVEAKCVKTLDEWLLSRRHVRDGESNRVLVYNQQMIARDLGFTPLVFLQLTEFKCGGLCVGMSWAHFLGDAFSAINCINTYGQIMSNHHTLTPKTTRLINPITTAHQNLTASAKTSHHCKSLKILDPLGDNWIIPSHRRMQTRTFRVKEISHLRSSDDKAVKKKKKKKKPFELICGIIWKSLSKVRGGNGNYSSEPKIVTVMRKKGFEGEDCKLLGNSNMAIGTVDAQNRTTSVADSDPLELADLIAERFVDETDMVEKLMEEHGGKGDFVIYGANLTFVDLGDASLYGLSVRNHGAVYAELGIEGSGDEGVVLVMPCGHEEDGESWRTVNVILREDELPHLANELKVEWGIL